MKCKVTGLGVLLLYPFPEDLRIYHMLRQYLLEDALGRIGKYEEVDEPQILDGDYDFPENILDSIFEKEVTLKEEEW